MKYFGYDVTPYAVYQICSNFTTMPDSVLKKMDVVTLRKMAIKLTDLSIKTGEHGSIFYRQLSLLEAMDENSFTSRDLADSCDECSKFFKQNYRQILQGENPDWVLYGIGLWYDRIKFQYCDCTIKDNLDRRKRGGTIYIRQGTLLKEISFIATVPSIDSSADEQYEILYDCDDWRLNDGSYGSYISINEYTKNGTEKHRRLRFFREGGRFVCRIDECQ